jgi:hypothetical protein
MSIMKTTVTNTNNEKSKYNDNEDTMDGAGGVDVGVVGGSTGRERADGMGVV